MKLNVRKEVDSSPTITRVDVRSIPNMGYQVEVVFERQSGWGKYRMSVRQSVIDDDVTVLRFCLYTQIGRYNNTWIDLVPEDPGEHHHLYSGRIVKLQDSVEPIRGAEIGREQLFVFLVLDPETYGQPAPTIAAWKPTDED